MIEIYKENTDLQKNNIYSLEAEKIGAKQPTIGYRKAKNLYVELLREVQNKCGKNSIAAIKIESIYYYGCYGQAYLSNEKDTDIIDEAEYLKKRLSEIQEDNEYLMTSTYVFYMRCTLIDMLISNGKLKAANEYLNQNYEVIEKNDALKTEILKLNALKKKLYKFGDALGLHTQHHIVIKK